MKEIVIAILAKDKGYCLDFYLHCILNQTYDKNKIHLWIRTNDNKDNTKAILDKFVKEHGSKYLSVYYNSDNIFEGLKKYGEHEWNAERFKILGDIRQGSINHAKEKRAHYFIADCDNFVTKDTLQHFYDLRALKFAGPMLKLAPNMWYSNFHNQATEYGYYKENDDYFSIWNQKQQGLIKVDTLHCTYFIHNDTLSDIIYNDGSGRYEYAILADGLRKRGINQYLDNTKFFGFLFLNDQIPDTFDNFIKNYWESEYNLMYETGEGYYDFVEIGTCDFDAIILNENPGKGISVEALPYYSNRLPEVNGVTKINAGISDKDGEMNIHWVNPDNFKKWDLPDWVRGSNSIGQPHAVVQEECDYRNISYDDVITISKIKVKSWKTLAKENNIKGVKLIKLDTEGHEHIIMKNLLEDLIERSSFRPEKIFFENNKLANKDKLTEVVQGFEKLGYVLSKATPMDHQLILMKDA